VLLSLTTMAYYNTVLRDEHEMTPPPSHQPSLYSGAYDAFDPVIRKQTTGLAHF